MLKTVARGMGLEPEKILTREALAEPHRIYVSHNEREDNEIRMLSKKLKEALKEELFISK